MLLSQMTPIPWRYRVEHMFFSHPPWWFFSRFLEKLKPKIRADLVSELMDKVLECIDAGLRDAHIFFVWHPMAELMEKWWLGLGNHHESSTSQESGNSSQDAQKICFFKQKKEPCCSPISDSWWSSIILIYFDCVNPRFAMKSLSDLMLPRGRYAWQPRDPKSGGEYAVRSGLCDSSSGAPCG